MSGYLVVFVMRGADICYAMFKRKSASTTDNLSYNYAILNLRCKWTVINESQRIKL